MHLFPDFKELLAAFEDSKVSATKDIDLFVATDADNRERIARALSTFGAPENVIEAARKMTADDVVYFGVSPLRVDILGSASGVDFTDVFAHALVANTLTS